jgi:hypothetical protein
MKTINYIIAALLIVWFVYVEYDAYDMYLSTAHHITLHLLSLSFGKMTYFNSSDLAKFMYTALGAVMQPARIKKLYNQGR